MAGGEEIIDSPSDWVAEHIERYVASGGEDGFEWRGAKILLLTTRGRRSAKLRRTALIFGEDGDRLLLVASKGGAPENPLWYENLVADPHVVVQVRDEVFEARASSAQGDEKARLWPIMVAEWPDYEEYQRATSRDIPLVVLTRA